MFARLASAHGCPVLEINFSIDSINNWYLPGATTVAPGIFAPSVLGCNPTKGYGEKGSPKTPSGVSRRQCLLSIAKMAAAHFLFLYIVASLFSVIINQSVHKKFSIFYSTSVTFLPLSFVIEYRKIKKRKRHALNLFSKINFFSWWSTLF